MASSSTTPLILGGLEPAILETYQAIRYSKMARSTNQLHSVIDITSVKQALESITENFVKFRVHYVLSEQNQSTPDSMCASLFQTFLKYEKSFSVEIVFKDESYEVIDICFSKIFYPIFFTDGKILGLLLRASLLEIHSVTMPKEHVSFLGNGGPLTFPTHFLLHPKSFSQPAVTFQERPPELLDVWIALLHDKWNEFYQDVKFRTCSLDYYSHGQYAVRRKFPSGQPAIFSKPQDLDVLKELQAVSIIPNCHPAEISQRPLTVDAIIDIDPSRFTTSHEKLLVANDLSEFLLQRGFVFKTHLSSGVHKGFHYIIETSLEKPFNLITNIASPENYFYNKPERIIINSVRESILAMLLQFLQDYKSDNILGLTSFDPNPYKIRLDLSRIALYSGRRSLYSLHKGTTSIVLPLPFNEPLTEPLYNEYTALSELDVAFVHSDAFHSYQTKQDKINKNTILLGYLNQEHRQLWKRYCMASNKALFLKKL